MLHQPKGDLEKVVTGFPHSSQLIKDKLATGCSLFSTQEISIGLYLSIGSMLVIVYVSIYIYFSTITK